MRTHSTARLTVVAALLLGAGAGVAQAQNDKTDKPLKGPEVTDRNVPGAAPDFGMGANRRFGDRVPPEVFRRALGVLSAEDAATDVRATPEQREMFKELVDNFEAAARKYRQEHATELGELRKIAGEPARRPRAAARQEAKAEPENLTPEQQKARDDARAKLREIEAGAPKIEDVYTKVWAELSEKQRTAVQTRLDAWRAEQSEKRMDDYVRRQGARKGKDAAPPTPPAAPARPARPKADQAGGEPDEMMAPKAGQPDSKPGDATPARVNARRERLLRLFAQLSPEEQAQLLERLENRLNGRRRGGDRPAQAEPKPAADPERVNVPKPDADKK